MKQKVRMYHIGENAWVYVEREWEMKFNHNLWYVFDGPAFPRKTLGRFSTLTEALAMVRQLRTNHNPDPM